MSIPAEIDIDTSICLNTNLREIEKIDTIVEMYKNNQLNSDPTKNDTKNFVFPYKNDFNILANKSTEHKLDFDLGLGSEKATDMSQFELKRILNNISTDFFTEKVFTNQRTVIMFQYFVNNLFNALIKYYRETNELNDLPDGENIDENDIVFVYKGGTTMKILHDKFNINSNVTKDVFDYSSYFKRSDSDYTVFINNKKFNFEQYMHHSRNLQVLSFYALIYIKNTIENCASWFLDIHNMYDQNNLRELLNNYNKKINELNNTIYDPENSKIDENLIKKTKGLEFIGIYVGNKNYFINDSEKQNFININNKSQISNLLGDYDLEMFRSKINILNKFGSTRKDFYIKNNNSFVSMYMFDDFNEYKNDYNNIYITFNESIVITDRDIEVRNKSSGFSLIRSKYNIVGIFKINNKYGIINIPSELIDVSFSYNNNKNMKHLFLEKDSFKLYITDYKYIKSPSFIYFSYTIIGFINDLTDVIFEYLIPWNQDKYEKRLNRLMYFILLYIIITPKYNDNKYKLGIEFMNDFKAFLDNYPYTNLSTQKSLDYITNKYDDFAFHDLFKYFKKLTSAETMIDSMTNKEIKIIDYIRSHIGKYNYFRKYLADLCIKNIDILKSLNHVSLNPQNIEQLGGYYEKYLKYKSKYLSLKNRL